MRLWIGPDNEIIDLDEDDLPHSLSVTGDPALFGLDPGPVARHMAEIETPGRDLDFDYDTIIVLAEMNGWVRVSRDASKGQAAVSASSTRQARRAIAHLMELAPGSPAIDLEIERIDGVHVDRLFCSLSADETARFVRLGSLPACRKYRTNVEDIGLLEALSGPGAAAAAAL